MGGLSIRRKEGQTVIIDGIVTITVYGTKNAKLHIKAPDHIKILRGELKAKEENDERESV